MKRAELPKGIGNIMCYASREEQVFEANARENGYKRQTTFFHDLSIAECCGIKSIKDTYKRVVESWLDDVRYFAEFVLALNWKSWEWNGRGDTELAELYSNLYYKANKLALKTYEGDDATYYFNVTD